MHEGHLMDEQHKKWQSTALQINLERTAADVEIVSKYQVLLKVVEGYYGVHKRTRELLEEINHPYVNWDFVIEQLKVISLSDFYKHNTHTNGLEALKVILDIYFDVIRSAPQEDIKERGVRYLFDYLAMIFEKSDAFLPRNMTLIPFIIESLSQIVQDQTFLFRKASTYLKTLLKFMLGNPAAIANKLDELTGLLYQVFRATYDFWLTLPDPREWFDPAEKSAEALDAYNQLIEPLSHHSVRFLVDELESIHNASLHGQNKLSSYLALPDYTQILNGYLRAADELERLDVYAGYRHLVRLDFLYHMINVPGLSDIHGPALREINRSLSMVFEEEEPENLGSFVGRIFALLKQSSVQGPYQDTIFNCISTLAKEIFSQNNHALADTFIEEVIAFGFQYPEVQGSTAEWQVRVNPAHIKNIRLWLEIIALKPRWTKRLLSALIINLKLGGIFVRDTDLLQKDISAFLNCDLAPAYNLAKQLLRMFPIYFSEIGAEGELREISTKVDELASRQDKLIHFLRKQSHVESNSLLVPFIEHIFLFWSSGDKNHIREYVPEEVYEQTAAEGEYFDGVHTIFTILFNKIGTADPRAFLAWDKKRIAKEINAIRQVPARDKERVLSIIRFYQLVSKKYNPQHIDLLHDLESSLMFD